MQWETRIHWALRIGAAACFIGHGAFGIITKAAWLPFFALVGIPADVAYQLMPVIGAVDIALGIAVLISPRPVLLLYMVAWTVWTAALRPLTGDTIWQMLERAGNYGVPLALLMTGPWPRTTREWLAPLHVAAFAPESQARLSMILVVTTALLLAGHGVLGILETPLLVKHATVVAGPSLAADVSAALGTIELLAALALLIRPNLWLAAGILVWKIATEALFLVSGDRVWEFIERGGSYAAPLALVALGLSGALPSLLPRVHTARPPRVMAALLLFAVLSIAGPLVRSLHAQTISDDSLVKRLRAGGLVLACRHAHTDHSNEDRMPVRFDDRSAQRNLSSTGEAQARALGDAIRAVRVPIGRVMASPMFRTYETATLAFGSATKTDSLLASRSADFRVLLRAPVAAGKVDVLITHNGALMPAFRDTGVGSFAEGDCAAVEPLGDRFTTLRRLSPEGWAKLAMPQSP